MKETILLAYSGGLDTSCILKWLIEKNYNVVCFMADVGQGEDFDAAKKKAINIGASDVIYKDLKKDFVENFVWPSVQMGLIYEERYLLGTSLARPCIVVSLIESAKQCGAKYIAHGATGKGNDQVRFELNAYALCPNIKIIAPWRCKKFCEQFQGRQALLEYARIHSIPISATPKAPWSIDGNIMHTSYESGMMEDPTTIPPENIFHMTKSPFKAPLNPYRVLIHFANGFPTKVEDVLTKKNYNTPLEIMNFLNEVGGCYGVGRIDIVENRFVGLKSRGVYETPGGTILYEAHRDLEIYCLDRECFRLKSYLRDRMSDYVYNGLWFSPEALFAADCLKTSQKNVSGVVRMEIGPGYTRPIARSSNKTLYNQELVSMDVHGEYNSSDASGFISISSIRIKEYYRAYGSYLLKK